MKTKIGIILISNGFSGAERVVKELLEKSDASRYVLFVNNEIYKEYKSRELKVVNLGDVFNKNIIMRIIKLKNISKVVDEKIRSENISVINPVLEYSFLLSSFLRSDARIIPSLHGEEINNLSKKSKFLQNQIILRILKKSSKLISVSNVLTKNIPEKYKKKTIVIPNGVDLETFRPIKSIKQKKNTILFVGRFIGAKGIGEILSAAKQLPKYEFWFAGQGTLGKDINLPNTKNLGFKNSNKLAELYNQATICIFPSYVESFGLVGLEAMACSKAVIATPMGFSEYIENGKDGIIIPSKDEKAPKEAIVDLMENPAKRKEIEKNAKKKADKHSWDKIARQYLKVFRSVRK